MDDELIPFYRLLPPTQQKSHNPWFYFYRLAVLLNLHSGFTGRLKLDLVGIAKKALHHLAETIILIVALQ